MRKTLGIALLFLVAATPFGHTGPRDAGKNKGVDWGGVRLGQSEAELEKLAKRKRRKLIGPSKSLFDMEKQIFARSYTVGDRKTLGSPGQGIKTQSILVLNDKVVGLDLSFRNKGTFGTFLKTLEKAGYVKEGEDTYVGKILEGPHEGQKVTVKAVELKAKKVRQRSYIIQVRCIDVAGDAAGGGDGDPAADALKRAL